MKSFFYLCDDQAIQDRAYDFIFSLCDCAEYLACYRQEDRDILLELIGTEYENIVAHLKKVERKSLWGMEGKYYSFAIGEPVQRMIKSNRFGGMVAIGNITRNGEVIGHTSLENLSLYKEEKRLYSICSHEGYEEIDKEFENKVSEFCLKEIETSKTYFNMKKVYKGLEKKSLDEIRTAREVLCSLYGYVSEEIGDWAYSPPERACSFHEYRRIARDFFSEEILEILNRADSFAALHPSGAVPMHLIIEDLEGKQNLSQEERNRICNHPRFFDSVLYRKICRELDILDVVFFKEGKVENWESADSDRAPSIVLRTCKENEIE